MHAEVKQHPSKARFVCKRDFSYFFQNWTLGCRGGSSPLRAIGAIASPKTYRSNFFHHDFEQFGKQHSIVLS